jgi:hypothetical protein
MHFPYIRKNFKQILNSQVLILKIIVCHKHSSLLSPLSVAVLQNKLACLTLTSFSELFEEMKLTREIGLAVRRARVKHSSLFCTSDRDEEEKKFSNIDANAE